MDISLNNISFCEDNEKSNLKGKFLWEEFNESMHYKPDPLISFTESPGIKDPELKISRDP